MHAYVCLYVAFVDMCTCVYVICQIIFQVPINARGTKIFELGELYSGMEDINLKVKGATQEVKDT